MTDEHDKPDDETPEATSDGPIGGERLAEARRAKQISVLEIAKELHVEEAKIRALENNDFDSLGAPVFAKGHLKKYSQLVGVNHDDVLTDYYRLTRSQEMPPVVVPRQKPRRELSPGPWIAAIVVVLVLALAYWLLVERPFAPPPVPAATTPAAESEPVASSETQPSEDVAPAEQAAEQPVEQSDEEPAEEPAAEEALAAQLPANEPEQRVESTPSPASSQTSPPVGGADEVRLSVTFVGDCWTEITDASGRRLYFQLGRSGRTVNVAGPGPLTVLFGDAENVEVRVNGEDFSIPAANLRGRTARLSIAGS